MKLHIENPAFGGSGVGRVAGKAVFVEYAIPGDVIKANVFEDYSSYSLAEISEILEPSPLRIHPACPAFAQCGGCSYLNVEYDSELLFKKNIVIDQLLRIGKLSPSSIPEVDIVSSKRSGYRSHVTLKIRNGEIGFFRKRSNTLVPLPKSSCLLVSESIKKYLAELKPMSDNCELKVAEDRNGNVFHSINEDDNFAVTECVDGTTYKRGIWNFFQSNKFLREKMLKKVYEYSELDSNSKFLDIGSGCGFFALNLAKNSAGGTGCEINRLSVSYAEENARINNITNTRFLSIPFEKYRPGKDLPDVIVADPPRAGLHKKSRHTINFIEPDILVYVSCNPSTFSRDIRDFIKNGYRLDGLTMIDMFPCTHHIELIGKLKK